MPRKKPTTNDPTDQSVALAESLLEGEPLQRLKLHSISKKLTDCLQANVVPAVPAIGDRKHEQHKDMLEWIGGGFDPEEFDANGATREMRKAR